MTRKVAGYVYELSVLMKDAGEHELEVFCITNNLIEAREGYLFTISDGNEKIGFGCFAIGLNEPRFRQLQYFALKSDYRGEGLGQRALKAALVNEVDRSIGCRVACKSGLRSFYEKIGFRVDLDEGDSLAMVYCDKPIQATQQVIRIFEIYGKELNGNLPLIEAEYGLRLNPIM